MYVLKKNEAIKVEQEASLKLGLSVKALMEKAGKQVAKEALKALAGKEKVVIVCGKGNNGGDGFVAARHLANKGRQVRLFILDPSTSLPSAPLRAGRTGSKARLKGEAADAFSSLKGTSANPVFLDSKNLGVLSKALKQADLVIDAIFGFGFKGKTTGIFLKAIESINQAGRPVLSVDVPSGLDADTGLAEGTCVAAQKTVTFTAPKVGLVVYPGLEFAGGIEVADIGIPANLVAKTATIKLSQPSEIASLLPTHPFDTHKKRRGRVLVVAGSVGMTGAAVLTAEAALRSGSGLVVLGVAESLNPILEVKLTEVMTYPLPETPKGSLSEKAFKKVLELIPSFDVLVLGPGLSVSPSTSSLVRKLVKEVCIPLVLDADGLNALVGKTDLLKSRKAPTVVTPHPGELARLLKVKVDTVQANRLKHAQQAASDWGLVVILKGARSIICAKEKATINTSGNWALATAGTGDVLAGMISSFIAQGKDVFEAATLATYLHGLSGDLAAEELTPYCVAAGDLIDFLPQAIKQLNSA